MELCGPVRQVTEGIPDPRPWKRSKGGLPELRGHCCGQMDRYDVLLVYPSSAPVVPGACRPLVSPVFQDSLPRGGDLSLFFSHADLHAALEKMQLLTSASRERIPGQPVFVFCKFSASLNAHLDGTNAGVRAWDCWLLGRLGL